MGTRDVALMSKKNAKKFVAKLLKEQEKLHKELSQRTVDGMAELLRLVDIENNHALLARKAYSRYMELASGCPGDKSKIRKQLEDLAAELDKHQKLSLEILDKRYTITEKLYDFSNVVHDKTTLASKLAFEKLQGNFSTPNKPPIKKKKKKKRKNPPRAPSPPRQRPRRRSRSNFNYSELVEGPFYHRAAHTTSIATVPSEPFINPDIELPVAPHEPAYCVCKKPSHGTMIMCDNKDCMIEWFHVQCVGLAEAPEGEWFCPECKK